MVRHVGPLRLIRAWNSSLLFLDFWEEGGSSHHHFLLFLLLLFLTTYSETSGSTFIYFFSDRCEHQYKLGRMRCLDDYSTSFQNMLSSPAQLHRGLFRLRWRCERESGVFRGCVGWIRNTFNNFNDLKLYKCLYRLNNVWFCVLYFFTSRLVYYQCYTIFEQLHSSNYWKKSALS